MVVVLGYDCLCEIVLGWFGGLVWFCLVWVFWLLAVGILALCLGLCCSGLGAVLAFRLGVLDLRLVLLVVAGLHWLLCLRVCCVVRICFGLCFAVKCCCWGFLVAYVVWVLDVGGFGGDLLVGCFLVWVLLIVLWLHTCY